MSKSIFITTPIYYINDKPHIGHTYSTFTADILARFYRKLGYNVFFSTWTDENSQKTVEAAKNKIENLKKFWRNSEENNHRQSNEYITDNWWCQKMGMQKMSDDDIELYQFYEFIRQKGLEKALQDYFNWKYEEIPLELVQVYTDWMASIWKSTWEKLQISFDDFIRTTEQRHKDAVIKFYLKAKNNWYIYKGKYKGLYCWKCEAFYKPEDLIHQDWKYLCPMHKSEVEQIEEENYFFHLTAFSDKLKQYFTQDHIFPEFRKKEMENNFLQDLEDFSISREGKKRWIPFPDDPNHVFYVWYDALTNYLSVLGYAYNDEKFDKFWNKGKIIHIIWKDILKFHSIYWPAMLWASDEKVPDKIVSHWFFTINGEKISKSLWNAISPVDLVEEYDLDAIRYYLFKDLKFGNDGDFSFERLKDLYLSNLVNWWWNLVSRVVNLSLKNNVDTIDFENMKIVRSYIKEKLSQFDEVSVDNNLSKLLYEDYKEQILLSYFENFDFQKYLNDWYQLVQFANKLIDEVKPWQICKEDKSQCQFFLKVMLYIIRLLGILSSMFLINWYEKLKEILGDETLFGSEKFEDIFLVDSLKFNLNKKFLYTKKRVEDR